MIMAAAFGLPQAWFHSPCQGEQVLQLEKCPGLCEVGALTCCQRELK